MKVLFFVVIRMVMFAQIRVNVYFYSSAIDMINIRVFMTTK